MDKSTQAVMFSSKRGDHQTPIDFFEQLHREFNFDMDVAASQENKLCTSYLSEEFSAFEHDWGSVNYCNPPYSRGNIEWINRATEMSKEPFYKATAMLLPARTDTKAFHYAVTVVDQIRFIKGRLKFQGESSCAPFPSMLLVWYGRQFNKISLPGKVTPNQKYHWHIWHPNVITLY